MGHRGTKPQKKVSTSWSSQLAYAVGLITTDGCLSGDGRHIDFTSKDRPLIKTFRSCLGIENSIGRKTAGNANQNNYYRVQFGDVNFYNWLLKIGLCPRKSKRIGVLEIPDTFFFDFLRGVFDGDGSISSYWDPRWHSSFMFYIQFTSGSRPYLEWLQQKIHQLSGATGRVKPSTRCYQLAFAKNAGRSIFRRMFYADGLPHLRRKFLKAERIFKIDDLHSHR